MKVLKSTVLLTVLMACRIGFGADYGFPKEYKKFDSYYVFNVETNGARICWGRKSSTGRILGIEYYVYGLTNVYSDKQYNDYIVVTPTNDFFYKTMEGVPRKIPAVCLVSKEEFDKVAAEQQSEQEQQIAEIRKRDEAARQESLKVTQKMLFEFRQREATNGSPSSQYLLGKMYLRGEYPCETNHNLGLMWINKAAAQDYTRAKEYLSRVKPVPVSD